ncbi:hypothetical protein D3C71_1568630 [compost metagenome]
MFQPADVDILQQRVGFAIGVFGGTGAVPADHDAVKPLTGDDGVADAGLEVFELGPCIQFGIADHGVVVGLGALIAVVIEGARIVGLAVFGGGVGATGDGAADTHAHLFAFHVVDRDDVDHLQEFD